MTRDRPRMLRHSLMSLSFQCRGKYRVILSDNSICPVNVSLNKALCNQYNAEYIKQSNLSICSHYDVLLKSHGINFVTILHDDDIVLPGFVDSVTNEIALDSSVAVLGINAFHFTESPSASDRLGSITCTGFRHLRISDDVIVRTPTELLLEWISPFSRGISPVSGCTFNTHLYDLDYFKYYSNNLHGRLIRAEASRALHRNDDALKSLKKILTKKNNKFHAKAVQLCKSIFAEKASELEKTISPTQAIEYYFNHLIKLNIAPTYDKGLNKILENIGPANEQAILPELQEHNLILKFNKEVVHLFEKKLNK